MEMFEHIGVAHRIEEVSPPCPGNVYHFEGLSEDEKPRTDSVELPTPYPFYYKINQNDFERVLREHSRALRDRARVWPRIQDLRQDEHGVTKSKSTGQPRPRRSSDVHG